MDFLKIEVKKEQEAGKMDKKNDNGTLFLAGMLLMVAYIAYDRFMQNINRSELYRVAIFVGTIIAIIALLVLFLYFEWKIIVYPQEMKLKDSVKEPKPIKRKKMKKSKVLKKKKRLGGSKNGKRNQARKAPAEMAGKSGQRRR